METKTIPINKSQGNDKQVIPELKMAGEVSLRISPPRQLSGSLTTEDLIHPHKASEIPG